MRGFGLDYAGESYNQVGAAIGKSRSQQQEQEPLRGRVKLPAGGHSPRPLEAHADRVDPVKLRGRR